MAEEKLENLNLILKKSKDDKTIVKVGNVAFGKDIVLIAGPCSIESFDQAMLIAKSVKASGADIFRGGVFKPRTSPYSFQGLGLEGLKILNAVSREVGIPVITEVLDVRDVDATCEYSDIIQIGARNMQNFPLLKEVGKCNKPVLLKRSMYATLWEFLNCGEYILLEGNKNLILCERGLKTFETYTRNTLDISAVPALHELSHLPVVVDPSHGTGKSSLVEKMALASVAAGADGLLIEVHSQPQNALSDRQQQIDLAQFRELSEKITKVSQFFKLF